MGQGVFEIKMNPVGRPFFVMKEPLGKVIVVSQSYCDRTACELSIVGVRETATIASVILKNELATNPKFEIIQEMGGMYFFKLISIQGDTILTSGTYCEAGKCLNKINEIKQYCRDAKIIDLL